MKDRKIVRVVVLAGVVAMLVSSASLVVAQDTCIVWPTATGTVRYFPEMGILNLAPVGSMVQSTYFRTTSENREFRRGFYEFHVPDFHQDFTSARLVVLASHGWTSYPVPPDTHEVSFYSADLVINTSDYNHFTQPLTTFQTDNNSETVETLSYDIPSLTTSFACSNLGIRFKLDSDPTYTGMGSAGSGFRVNNNDPPSRIEVTLAEGNPPCLPELAAAPSPEGGLISWNPAYGAIGYDIAIGSLQDLHTHHGFTNQACLANDQPGTSVPLPLTPAAGDGYWILIRTAHSCGCGTYQDRGMNHMGFIRDGQITACPCS